ncbi:MAG: RNA 2',3'-cyclic phosphodiesterase [Gammaproteobacteria bacterium]
MVAPASDKKRLFLAVWPSEQQRSLIRAACYDRLPSGSGKLVDLANLHITLVFIGSVEAQAQQCIEDACDTIRGNPFQLLVNHYGYWSKPGVLWAGPSEMPVELIELQSRLMTALADCRLSLDQRPYKAHITLMRKVRKLVKHIEIDSFVWDVQEFSLILSTPKPQGVCYRPLKSWQLG